MAKIWEEHFWRHVWGPWRTVTGVIYTWRGVPCPAEWQERTCKVCGKKETWNS